MARVLNSSITTAAAMVAAMAGLSAGLGFTGFRMPSIKRVRDYPQPPCSPREVIAAHNAQVKTRQVLRQRERRNLGWEGV